MGELEQIINDERCKLEQINVDLQELLGDITQVNREINDTDGEVQNLNKYNQETVENIRNLLQKVNLDLNDILNMPQPPASQMQKIREQRMISRAQPRDELEQGVLSNMFQQEQQPPASPMMEQLSPEDMAVAEASSQPWWDTLDESEKAMYRNVPERRADMRREGMLRVQQEESRRARAAACPSRPIYLTEWKNMLTPEEMRVFDSVPEERAALEEEGKRRLAEKKANQGFPTGGTRPFSQG